MQPNQQSLPLALSLTSASVLGKTPTAKDRGEGKEDVTNTKEGTEAGIGDQGTVYHAYTRRGKSHRCFIRSPLFWLIPAIFIFSPSDFLFVFVSGLTSTLMSFLTGRTIHVDSLGFQIESFTRFDRLRDSFIQMASRNSLPH